MKNKTYAGFLKQHSGADNILSAQREPEPHVEYIRHKNNEHAFDCIPPPLLLESICSVLFFFFFLLGGCSPSLCIFLEEIIEHFTCYNRDLDFLSPKVTRLSVFLSLHL